MIIEISKDLYSKTALLKAAYTFTDRAYIYISQNENNYVIDIDNKSDCSINVLNEFKNELLSQTLRQDIFEKTKNVRELIISRALATTIIDNNSDVLEFEDNDVEEDILKDWFENENNN